MNLVYYYFLVTYFTAQISRTAPPKKHVFFQIDEFIKQLMKSERFDALADIIADKAAQKIRNMNSQSSGHAVTEAIRKLDNKYEYDPISVETFNRERELSHKVLRYDEKSINEPDKKKFNEERMDKKSTNNRESNENNNFKLSYYNKDNYGREKEIEKSTRSNEKKVNGRNNAKLNIQKKTENIRQTDTQKFLQNQMASKELTLNFNHLKQEVEKHRFNVKRNDDKSSNGYDKNKKNQNNENNRVVHNNEDIEKKTANAPIKMKLKQIDSKELLLTDGSAEHEQATFHAVDDDKNKSQNSGEFKPTNDSKTGIKEKRNKSYTKYEDKSDEKPVQNLKTQNDSKEDSKFDEDLEAAKTFIDKVMDKVSLELNNPSYPSKEVVEVGVHRMQSGEPKEKISPGNSKGHKHSEKNNSINKAGGIRSAVHTSYEYIENDENSTKRLQTKYINTYK